MGNDVRWIKLTTDMFDNRKIRHLRKLPEGNSIVLIWIMLLTMAGRCNSNGMIFLTENIPYTTKMLADELDFEENTVRLALQALCQMGMVIMDESKMVIANWEEYQNIEGMEKIREQTRKRTAEYRLRKKQKEALPDGVSRDGDVTVTQCDGTDIELYKEEEQEKESLSISNDIDCRTSFAKEAQLIASAWNQMAQKNGLALVRDLKAGQKRYSNLKARVAQYGIETVMAAIDNVDHSPFLKGQEGARPFFITFDWFVLPNNFIKVSDGNYLDRAGRESREKRKTNNPFLRLLEEGAFDE